MTSLVLNNYTTFVDRTAEECGNKSFPIWLLVNHKYPADIDDIWNPIMYEIQDKVYRSLRTRIDSKSIFIKSAFCDIGRVPDTVIKEEVENSIVMLRKNILLYQPKLLIAIGAIANEYVRRVLDTRPENGPKYWNTCNLGNEFEQSITNFDIKKTNWIPLLRRNTKSSKSIENWEDNNSNCDNIAAKIANKLIENKDSLNIWIE